MATEKKQAPAGKSDEGLTPDQQAELTAQAEGADAVVVYYYLPSENPTEAGYPGVPLRNLLQHDVDNLPAWIRKSLDNSPMYSTEPPTKSGKKAAPKEATDEGGSK